MGPSRAATQTCTVTFLPCLEPPVISQLPCWSASGKVPLCRPVTGAPALRGLGEPALGWPRAPLAPRTPLCSDAPVEPPAQCLPACSPDSPRPGDDASRPLPRAPCGGVSRSGQGAPQGPCPWHSDEDPEAQGWWGNRASPGGWDAPPASLRGGARPPRVRGQSSGSCLVPWAGGPVPPQSGWEWTAAACHA